MISNADKLEYKYDMDKAISHYIAICTGTDSYDADYSAINQDIDDAIEMLGGTPAKEDE